MSATPRAGCRLVVVTVLLAITEAVLGQGGGRLPGPGLWRAGRAGVTWSGGADPASIVIGLVHTLAIIGVTYLLGAALLEGLVQLGSAGSGSPRPRLAPRLPWATGAVQRAAGVGLALSVGAAATFAASPAGAVAPSSRSTPVMHLDGGAPPPVMHLDAPIVRPARHAEPRLSVRAPRTDRPRPPGPMVWIIRPGDHLWKVAGLDAGGGPGTSGRRRRRPRLRRRDRARQPAGVRRAGPTRPGVPGPAVRTPAGPSVGPHLSLTGGARPPRSPAGARPR